MNATHTFGSWLKRRRGGLGLTQKELAQQVGYAEVTLRKVEADELRPSRQMAEKLAEVLQIESGERTQFVRFARDELGWEDVALPTQMLPAALPSPPTNLSLQPTTFLDREQEQANLTTITHYPRSATEETWTSVNTPLVQPFSAFAKVDWGDAPNVNQFYGRQPELAQLRKWLIDDHSRLVAMLGMGGLGKTALIAMLATQVEQDFEYIIWRSLRNAPPLEEILGQCIRVVSSYQVYELPSGMDNRLALLMEYLRQRRCLLVLDNFETVLRSERAGHYLPGYEGYGQLLQRIGEGRHQSCLLLTSREKPKELATLEGDLSPVRTLSLLGLHLPDGRALLKDRGLFGGAEHWETLQVRYSGNPLALKLVAEMIRELFAGNIAEFLNEEITLFGDIAELLAQQFARLSPLEQEVMFWLAVEREPVSLEELRGDLVQPSTKLVLLEVLRSLRQRSLIERVVTGFTLQNVVLEYLTARLIDQVCDEIISGQVVLLQRQSLLKAQAKNYVRESQRTLILAPMANRLVERLGRQGTVERLDVLLSALRHTQPRQAGHAGGNILNILVYLNGNLRNFDFSQLAIWQADLRSVDAQDVDFRQADLSRSVFTDTFAGVLSVAFSSDGERLAAGTYGNEIRIWQVNNGQPLLTCVGHTRGVTSVCFSPDGRMLASGSWDGTVRLWDAHTGQCLTTLLGHIGSVISVCFSPDGHSLASGSWDCTARLWDIHTRRCLTTLQGHAESVLSICFSPDGHSLASGSWDCTVRLWDIHTGQCLTTLQGHINGVTSVCFSPDGHSLASGSEDRTVRLWDVQSWQCLTTLQGHAESVLSICFSPDGHSLASGSWDCTVRLWDIHTRRCLTTLQGHSRDVRSVCFSPDGHILASGSWDRTVRLWDIHTEQCLTTLQGYMNEIFSVCFSPDGRTLASGSSSDSHVWLWDINTGQRLTTLQGHTRRVLSISFSLDGHILASGSQDRTVRLWDIHAEQCLTTLQSHINDVTSVCFSPDGHILASGSADETVRLWDTHTGQCLTTLQGHTLTVWSVCFSPDGHILASGSEDRTVRLWDVQSWQCLATLQGHTGSVLSVCFSPDGHTLVSTSADQTVRLWDVHNRESFATLQGHTYPILCVGYSPDGSTLACGSTNDTTWLLDLQTGTNICILRSDRPYERMNITGVIGLTSAQVMNLKALGAVEDLGQCLAIS